MTMQREGQINGQEAIFDMIGKRYALVPRDSYLVRKDCHGVIGYYDAAGSFHDLTWLSVLRTDKIQIQSSAFADDASNGA